MSKSIKLSAAVSRLRTAQDGNALTMGPELIPMGQFQITGTNTIEFGEDQSFEVLSSDKNVSFSYDSLFGAQVKGKDKAVWEVLVGDGVSLTEAQEVDGDNDQDIPLAALKFRVTKASNIKGYDKRDLHTGRSYQGYWDLLKEKQDEIKVRANSKPEDVPTTLVMASLARIEKQRIYSSPLIEEGAMPLYSLQVEMIEATKAPATKPAK